MLLTDVDVETLQSLCQTAAAHQRSLSETMRATREPVQERHRNFANTVNLSGGHVVTFTLEEQPQFLARHLSVSYGDGRIAPQPSDVEAIMRVMGFERDLDSCMIWMEEFGRDQKAVNVLEPIDPNT